MPNLKYITYLLILLFILLSNNTIIANYISEKIPFQIVNGLMVTQAELNGEHGNFIIDTGAEDIIINSEYIISEHLNSISLETLSGTINVHEMSIHQLKMGKLIKENLSALVLDLNSIEEYTGQNILGILGSSIFNFGSIVIDFQTMTFSYDNEPLDDDMYSTFNSIPYKIVNGVPITWVNISNKLYPFILDTGATCHFIDIKISNVHHDIISITDTEIEVKTISDQEVFSKKAILSYVEIGNQIFRNEIFYTKDFTSMKISNDISLSGIISLKKLAENQLAIDFVSNALYYR